MLAEFELEDEYRDVRGWLQGLRFGSGWVLGWYGWFRIDFGLGWLRAG